MSGFCYAKAKAVLCCSIICASIAAQAHVQFSSRVSLIMHKVVGLTFKTRTLLPRWHRGPQVHLKLIWQSMLLLRLAERKPTNFVGKSIIATCIIF